MPRDISNSDDVIDSRDVIARIDELQDERESLVETLEDAKEAVAEVFFQDQDGEPTSAMRAAVTDAQAALAAWDADNLEELKALQALADEAEGYADDWQHGVTLIRDSYFTDYAQELCEDIGDVPKDLPHYIEIDWNATARNIQADYTSVEFDGVTYWVR